MSKLIDGLKDDFRTQACIEGKWYVAKPLFDISLKQKIKDCFRILRGKSFAVHYKQDE